MTSPRLVRFALVPLLILGALSLIWLGFLLLRQALSIGAAEAAMVAITLLFVVALPLALPLLTLAARWASLANVPGIVPMTGGKVP